MNNIDEGFCVPRELLKDITNEEEILLKSLDRPISTTAGSKNTYLRRRSLQGSWIPTFSDASACKLRVSGRDLKIIKFQPRDDHDLQHTIDYQLLAISMLI